MSFRSQVPWQSLSIFFIGYISNELFESPTKDSFSCPYWLMISTSVRIVGVLTPVLSCSSLHCGCYFHNQVGLIVNSKWITFSFLLWNASIILALKASRVSFSNNQSAQKKLQPQSVFHLKNCSFIIKPFYKIRNKLAYWTSNMITVIFHE